MVVSVSKRTFKKSFSLPVGRLETDIEEKMPVYMGKDAEVKKAEAAEIIIDYSDHDIRNITSKYGMRAADHVITAYLMKDVSDHDYNKLLIDMKDLEESENYDKDFKGFAKRYDKKDFIIPGVVLDALKSGDVEAAREKLDKYHQLADSGTDVYVGIALKEIDPSKFMNIPIAKAIGFNKGQIYNILENASLTLNHDDVSIISNIEVDLATGDYDAASMKMTKYFENVSFAMENQSSFNPDDGLTMNSEERELAINRASVNVICDGFSNDIDNYAEEFAKRKKINKVINKRLKRYENDEELEKQRLTDIDKCYYNLDNGSFAHTEDDIKKELAGLEVDKLKEKNLKKIKELRQEFEEKYGVRKNNPFAPVIQAVYMGDADAAKEAYQNIYLEQMKKVNDSIDTLKGLDKSLFIGGGNNARKYDEKCEEAIDYINREFGPKIVNIYDQSEIDKEIDKCYYNLDNGSFVRTEGEIKRDLRQLEKDKLKEEKVLGKNARFPMIKLIKNDNIKELKYSVDDAIKEWDESTPGQRYEWEEYRQGPQYSEEFIETLRTFRESYLQAPNDLEHLRTSRVPRQDMNDFVTLSYLESRFDSKEADKFLEYYQNLEFSNDEDVKTVRIHYDTESEYGIGVQSARMSFLSKDGKTVGEAIVPEEFNEIIDAYQIYYRLNNDNLSL